LVPENCKSQWALLSKDALREEETPCLIKFPGHVSLGGVGHLNKNISFTYCITNRIDIYHKYGIGYSIFSPGLGPGSDGWIDLG
jgi:hypothetical protein